MIFKFRNVLASYELHNASAPVLEIKGEINRFCLAVTTPPLQQLAQPTESCESRAEVLDVC